MHCQIRVRLELLPLQTPLFHFHFSPKIFSNTFPLLTSLSLPPLTLSLFIPNELAPWWTLRDQSTMFEMNTLWSLLSISEAKLNLHRWVRTEPFVVILKNEIEKWKKIKPRTNGYWCVKWVEAWNRFGYWWKAWRNRNKKKSKEDRTCFRSKPASDGKVYAVLFTLWGLGSRLGVLHWENMSCER